MANTLPPPPQESRQMTGEPPRMEWIAVADLLLDRAYQRDTSTKTASKVISHIIAHFSWAKFQCLTVSCRPDGKRFVVDGQHRLIAVRKLKIAEVPCVLFDVPSRQIEARMFQDINRVRRAVSALDMHRAAVAAGDAAAVAVEAVLARVDMEVAPHTNFTCWQPKHVAAIGSLKTCIKAYGETATEAALIACQEAWPGQIIRNLASLAPGLACFYEQALRDEAFDPDLFLGPLGARTMIDWITESTRLMNEHSMGRAEALARLLHALRADMEGGPYARTS
jgi:hypothetical protein